MKFFWLSKYYSLNILLYFSIFANFVYIFFAFYLFKIRTCSGLLCFFDPLVYSLFYYFGCITIVFILSISLLMEYNFYRLKKSSNNHYILENNFFKKLIIFISSFCFLLIFFVFFIILKILLYIGANID